MDQKSFDSIYVPGTGLPDSTAVKKKKKKTPTCNAGDIGTMGWIPGLEISPGGRNDNPLQDSCLGNPMDRGAWWAAVHGVAKSNCTGLRD